MSAVLAARPSRKRRAGRRRLALASRNSRRNTNCVPGSKDSAGFILRKMAITPSLRPCTVKSRIDSGSQIHSTAAMRKVIEAAA